MACKIENIKFKGQDVESELGSKLISIYGDVDTAKDVYDRIASQEFRNKFGEWIDDIVEERTNSQGEPQLIEKIGKDGSKFHYFIMKNGEPFYLEVPEFSGFSDVDLTNEVNQITSQLAYVIYRDNFKDDFENIDGSSLNIKKAISDYINKKKKDAIDLAGEEAASEYIEYLDNIIAHSDEFESEIKRFFSERKIEIEDDLVESETQDSQEEGLQGGDIIQSFERNSKDNATANVKLMLSFLPKIDDRTGEVITGRYLDEPLFNSFDSVYKELQKELADITTMYLSGEVNDIFNVMKARISDLSANKKSYNRLLKILDNIDENKKTEFVQAFYLSKINFYTTTFNRKGKNNILFTVQNVSDANNPTKKLLNEYYSNFKSKHIKGNALKKEGITKFLSEVENLLLDARKKNRTNKFTKEDQFYNQFEKDVERLGLVMQDLGIINTGDVTLDFFLKGNKVDLPADTYKLMYNNYLNTLIQLKNLFGDILSNKINASKENIFSKYSGFLFNDIANSELYFKEDLSDNTIFSNGKTYWTFANPAYINNKVNTYKQHPDTLDQLLKTPYGSSSLWAKHLLGKDENPEGDYKFPEGRRKKESYTRLNSFEIGNFNSFQEKNRSREGNDNTNISKVDQNVDKINKVLGAKIGQIPIYSTITPADKATLHEIKIDSFIADTLSSNNPDNIVFSKDVIKIFTDYFESEIDRMRQAYKELQEGKDLRVHYHVDSSGEAYDKNGMLIGNAFKLTHILPELDISNMNEEQRINLGLFNNDGSPKNVDVVGLTPSQKDIIRRAINKSLANRVRLNVERLEGMNILNKKINNDRSVVYLTEGIDRKILAEYSNNIKLTEQSVIDMVSDYTVNSIIASVEYSKLFSGDPAYYKSMIDFFKRIPATYTDGLNLRLGITKGDGTFNAAVIENIEKVSDFIDEIKESINAAPNLTKKEKDYISKAYTSVNQTDAQGWITLDRWFFLISRLGKWNPKIQSVYDKIKKDQELSPEDLKYVAQPLKGVYFGLVNNVPTYLKYSQAVLVPQLTKGTQLDSLRKAMEKQGVGESIVLDGVKVGASVPNKITDESGNIMNNLKLDYLTLSNADWKLQQDLPVKGVKSTLIGSQIKKNILSSLDPIADKDIVDSINDTLSQMSYKGIDKLSIEIGKDSENRINPDRVYSMLEKELIERGSPANALRSVQKNMPIEAIPGIKDKLYNILFAKVRSSAVKIKSNGGSFIQISNFGLDKTTANDIGVTWLKDPSELKPPVIEYDAEGKGYIVPGQIFLSHSQIASYIPNYRKLSREELLSKIDSRLLRAIGYRIPNQGQSSNDILDIVGILPPSMGDSIVAYSEITTKTGSDFDIDKMYVMLPNPTVNINKASYRKAKDYVRNDLNLELEEMYNELEYAGYNMEEFADLDKLYSAVEEAFIKEHVLNAESDLEYHADFVSRYGIGEVDKLRYLEPSNNIEKSNKQLQNQLFELYWGVLSRESSYGDLITPIDFPYVKNKIKELHGDSSKQTGESFKFHDPLYQLDLKFSYNLGKRGVGITANMLVDHNIGRFSQMTLTQENNEMVVFDNEYSETINGTKYKIRDTISAFLNAFVDIAKDPYINDGNFTSLTSQVAFYLIRAGKHPDWVVSFIGNPVLKELTEFTSIFESKSIRVGDKSKSAFEIIRERYVKKLGREPRSKEYSLEELDSQIKEGQAIEDAINILDMFDMYGNSAKKLNASVQLSRFDTLGAGKDFIDLMIFNNKIREMYLGESSSFGIKGHFKKYANNGKKTSLGVNAENTILYLNNILDENPSLFLLASSPIRDLVNDISIHTYDSRNGNKGLLKDAEYGKLIFDEVYKYIMSDFQPFKIEGNPVDYIKQTIEMIADYKFEEKDFDAADRNFFIDQLEIFTNSFGIDNKNKSPEMQDKLYRAARDLMEEDPELADRIFISSFHMNGFQTRFIDIKEYIPHQWFLNNNIRDFIRAKHTELKGSSVGLQSFKNQFIRNNWDNNVVAPVIPSNIVKSFNNYSDKIAFTYSNSIFTKKQALGPSSTYETIDVYPEFVKRDDALFKLLGYYNELPVYVRTTTLGYTDKESYLNLKEYKYNSILDSHFPFNRGGDEMARAYTVSEEIKEMEGFIPASEVILDTGGTSKILEKSIENILFSELNDVSLQEDFTKDDC